MTTRTALVTGGMGGLGEAICIKLAALGYQVVVTHSPGNRKVQEWLAGITLADKSKVFNTARIEALEVENLIEAAEATIVSAPARRECRGAHTVKVFERGADDPEFPLGRNDVDWMKHTLWFKEGNRLEYKPVQLQPLSVESVPPKVRTF